MENNKNKQIIKTIEKLFENIDKYIVDTYSKALGVTTRNKDYKCIEDYCIKHPNVIFECLDSIYTCLDMDKKGIINKLTEYIGKNHTDIYQYIKKYNNKILPLLNDEIISKAIHKIFHVFLMNLCRNLKIFVKDDADSNLKELIKKIQYSRNIK